jgi:two-component system chemotaxis response regulator CheB
MPRAALQAADPDHVVKLVEMAPLLASLAREEAPLGRAASAQVKLEVDIALGERLGTERLLSVAEPSTFSCPHCNGVLSEMKGEGPLRYRCQIGHAFSAAVLDDCQDRALEQAMGVALRIVEERVALVERLAEDARIQGNHASAELHKARMRDYAEQIQILRDAVATTVGRRAAAE